MDERPDHGQRPRDGVRYAWPWDDRGRSKVTRAEVFEDLVKLVDLVRQSTVPGTHEVVRGLPWA